MTVDAETLMVLQTLRVKGPVSASAVAESLGLAQGGVNHVLLSAASSGWVVENKEKFRIVPAGQQELSKRLDVERAAVDHAALLLKYENFHAINCEFKQLVTDWQIRDGAPNLHLDVAYDASIVRRLDAIDARLTLLLVSLESLVPRLAHYPQRFDRALKHVRSGDSRWLARPILDSYHTLWFELHEDLIGLLGFTREAEATRGRAE